MLKGGNMQIWSKIGLERSTVITFIAFMVLIFLPIICNAIGVEDASQIAKISESNPYQALTCAMGLFCVTCIGACAYVYNQSLNQGKDLIQIQKDQITANLSLADKIQAQTVAIERNQDILEKSIDVTNARLDGRPCLMRLEDLKRNK